MARARKLVVELPPAKKIRLTSSRQHEGDRATSAENCKTNKSKYNNHINGTKGTEKRYTTTNDDNLAEPNPIRKRPSEATLTEDTERFDDDVAGRIVKGVMESVGPLIATMHEEHNQEIRALIKEKDKAYKTARDAVNKITDDTIKGRWRELSCNVRNLVNLLPMHQRKGNTSVLETLRQCLPTASFDAVPEALHEKLMEVFLEAYIWSIVNGSIFLGCGRQWKGKFVQALQTLKLSMLTHKRDPTEMAEVALWLSEASRITLLQPDKKSQEKTIDNIAESLLNMFNAKTSPKVRDRVKSELAIIVQDATELLLMFTSSKALLITDWPAETRTYRKWMNDDLEHKYLAEETSNERCMVIRPALEKFGNADSENHDLSTVLFKPILFYF